MGERRDGWTGHGAGEIRRKITPERERSHPRVVERHVLLREKMSLLFAEIFGISLYK